VSASSLLLEVRSPSGNRGISRTSFKVKHAQAHLYMRRSRTARHVVVDAAEIDPNHFELTRLRFTIAMNPDWQAGWDPQSLVGTATCDDNLAPDFDASLLLTVNQPFANLLLSSHAHPIARNNWRSRGIASRLR